MKKSFAKVVSIILAFVILMAASGMGVFADSFVVVDEVFDYYENGSGGISITGYRGDDPAVVIPETINNLPVTEVSSATFFYRDFITSVTLPDTVVYIGDWAFIGCKNLTSIEFPSGLEFIGQDAFTNCGLYSVTIPESVNEICASPFSSCQNLTSIEVDEDNENYTSVDGVLYTADMTELVQYPAGKNAAEFTVPHSTVRVGNGSFKGANKIESVVFGDNLVEIEPNAFANCSSLAQVILPSSLEIIGENAFAECVALKTFVANQSLISIGYSAFVNCSSLEHVELGENLQTIEEGAFEYCNSLTEVDIPASVSSIGANAFSFCDSLTYINVDSDNQYYYSDNFGALISKEDSVLMIYPKGKTATSYTIPDGVIAISEFAFYYNVFLEKVTLPSGVTTIGDSAFMGCNSLSDIEVPDSLRSIGGDAFSNTAYYRNDGNWTDGILYIGNNIIKAKNSLDMKEFTVSSDINVVADFAFEFNNTIEKITVDGGIIGDHAFAYGDTLKEVVVADGEIGSYAFGYDDALEKVTVKGGKIDRHAFAHCDMLSDVVVTSGEIGDHAFAYDDSLHTVTILGGSVSRYAFGYCDNLSVVNVADEVESLHIYAFMNYSDLPLNIYYEGTEAQWENILEKDYESNVFSDNVTIHFSAEFETGIPGEGDEDTYDHEYLDKESGVSVSTDTDAELYVENIISEEIVGSIEELLPKAEVESVFEINLQRDGEEVQPEDTITIRIPSRNPFARVFRMEEDGTLTDMNARYIDGFLVFTTEHLSFYALGQKIASAYDLGDVNMDENLSIRDATAIQKHLVELAVYQPDVIELLMDYDSDGTVTIKDSTAIQKKLAGII